VLGVLVGLVLLVKIQTKSYEHGNTKSTASAEKRQFLHMLKTLKTARKSEEGRTSSLESLLKALQTAKKDGGRQTRLSVAMLDICDWEPWEVPVTSICDGKKDCKDLSGSDEDLFCEGGYGTFTCLDGITVLKYNLVCDGKADCDDEEDEAFCVVDQPAVGTTTLAPTTLAPTTAPPSKSMLDICDWTPWEVPVTSICDGKKDCEDSASGSDEDVFCAGGLGTFTCFDGITLLNYNQVCDGKADCDDGEDEEFCVEATT